MLDRGLQGIQSRLLTQYLAAGIARQVTSAAQKLQMLYFLPSEPFKWRVQYNLSFLEHLSPWNSPSPRQALGNDSWETSKGVGGVRFSSYVSLSTARNPMPAPVFSSTKASCEDHGKTWNSWLNCKGLSVLWQGKVDTVGMRVLTKVAHISTN
jgi:hypothetical protein